MIPTTIPQYNITDLKRYCKYLLFEDETDISFDIDLTDVKQYLRKQAISYNTQCSIIFNFKNINEKITILTYSYVHYEMFNEIYTTIQLKKEKDKEYLLQLVFNYIYLMAFKKAEEIYNFNLDMEKMKDIKKYLEKSVGNYL